MSKIIDGMDELKARQLTPPPQPAALMTQPLPQPTTHIHAGNRHLYMPPPHTTIQPLSHSFQEKITPVAPIVTKRLSHIVPIASGKGGVGKTTLVTYSGHILSKYGRTVIVDLDGLPDTDIYLRPINPHAPTIHKAITENISPSDACSPTIFQNLFLVKGGVRRMTTETFVTFYDFLTKIEADYLLVDLGAGLENVGIFSKFNTGIIVVNPEVASIRDSYHYIANCICERLLVEFSECSGMSEYIEKLRTGEVSSISELKETLRRSGLAKVNVEPFIQSMNAVIRRLHINLVVNRAGLNAEMVDDLLSKVTRNLSVPISCVGNIPNDKDIHLSSSKGVLSQTPPKPFTDALQGVLHNVMKDGFALNTQNTDRFGSIVRRFFGL